MSSPGAKIAGIILKLYTYPYRKNHKSLSRSVKLKNKPYKPPEKFCYEVKRICGTDIEILSPPDAVDGVCAVVQFHGGGHTQTMNAMYRKVAEKLCKISGCAVYSIDYKAGEGMVYPSVHEECFKAYTGLTDRLLKNKKIIAVGDSFGANLMLSTCLKLRDGGLKMPVALIAVSCYIDLASSGRSYEYNCYRDPLYALPKNQSFSENEKNIRRITPYCGKTSLKDKYLSPAYAEYGGFPDMLIQCGGLETSASDSRMLKERAESDGVNVKFTEYEGVWHDFQYITPFLRESKAAWSEIKKFIDIFI